jgi:hypothetical protein
MMDIKRQRICKLFIHFMRSYLHLLVSAIVTQTYTELVFL